MYHCCITTPQSINQISSQLMETIKFQIRQSIMKKQYCMIKPLDISTEALSIEGLTFSRHEKIQELNPSCLLMQKGRLLQKGELTDSNIFRVSSAVYHLQVDMSLKPSCLICIQNQAFWHFKSDVTVVFSSGYCRLNRTLTLCSLTGAGKKFHGR